MTKLGRHNPYSAWLISVQPDICKCLLFPLFVAFCNSVYCFSYVSHLPLFRHILSPFTAFPFTHLPNPLTLSLLGFSGKLQFFFNADRFCVQVPHPNAPSMPFSPSSCQPPGFSGKVSGLQLFFADQVLCAGPVLPSMPWGGASISSDVMVTRQLVSRFSFSFLFIHSLGYVRSSVAVACRAAALRCNATRETRRDGHTRHASHDATQRRDARRDATAIHNGDTRRATVP